MPVQDWTRVDAGIFHAIHHGWIAELSRALNHGALPPDYYALPEQHAAGFGPGVLTLDVDRCDVGNRNADLHDGEGGDDPHTESHSGAVLAAPELQPVAESDMAFYRRKQKTVTVRHVSDDHVVAIIEVLSPGNKASRIALRAFVAKAAELLDKQIHLLILDLHPPGRRDPQGLHATIWEEITGQECESPPSKPLALAAYETGLTVRAYVVNLAVGDVLAEMPLFLEPQQAVSVPLETTYLRAFDELPRRWQRVLEKAPA